jgi:hypothetical protein
MKPNLYCCTSQDSLDLAEQMRASAAPEFNVCLLLGHPYTHWREKLRLIIHCLKIQRELGHDYMIYADSDCLFLRPCVEDLFGRLPGFSALFQVNGTGGIGTGLFLSRNDDQMIHWWQGLDKLSVNWGPSHQNEEEAANRDRHLICHGILPSHEYWTPCVELKDSGARQWTLKGFPPEARFVHLSCIYPEAKRNVMSQVIKAHDLSK